MAMQGEGALHHWQCTPGLLPGPGAGTTPGATYVEQPSTCLCMSLWLCCPPMLLSQWKALPRPMALVCLIQEKRWNTPVTFGFPKGGQKPEDKGSLQRTAILSVGSIVNVDELDRYVASKCGHRMMIILSMIILIIILLIIYSMTLAMPISGRLTYPRGKRGAHQLNNCSATAMHLVVQWTQGSEELSMTMSLPMTAFFLFLIW